MNKKLLYYFFLYLVCPAFLTSGYSQSLSFNFQEIGVKEGLNVGGNTFLKKDSQGYLWISSTNGLFCYNGQKIKRYIPIDKDTTSMLGNNIQSNFFEDSSSNIWFSTSHGINVYQRKSDNFKRIQIKNLDGQKIQDRYTLIHLENDSLLAVLAAISFSLAATR